jgi:iron complex outermembrane receptor protein
MFNRQVLATATFSLIMAGTAGAEPVATGSPTAGAPAVAAGADSGDMGLAEIVVTAQRREESSQRAAIAISTVTGDAVANANVSRPGGLTDLVPALQATDDTGPYSIFYVRGVGNYSANALSDPALLFNFDGVTVSRAGTSGFFYDLERVEVLKGPQGTLYGRNATGGAINVISKAPQLGQFGGDASVEFGNYSSQREDIALNLPVGDISAFRIAAFHVRHDGYMDDGTESQNDTGTRVSFLLVPSDTLKIKIVADYFHQGGDQAGGTITGVTSAFTNAPTFSPSDRLGFFSPQVQTYLQTQTDFLNGAKFVPFQNVNSEDNRFSGISATVDWTTPVGTVTVVPAYRDSKLDYSSFATGVLLAEQSHEKETTFEARLASPSDQAFRYIVGLYYLDDPEDVPLYNINQQANATFSQYSTDTISHAAFANLSYAILPDVRLEGGARYTKDSKDFFGAEQANAIICTIQTPFGPSCPGAGVLPYTQTAAIAPEYFNPNGTIRTLTTFNNNQSASYNKVTWRAGLDWDVSDRNLLYASAETGFKSGGFFFSSDYNVYQPETITAYTIGSKNRFFDNKLQANVELFDWKYKNQQISHLGTDSLHDTIFPTQNVGQSTIKGIEFDLQARPLQNTVLSADIQYNDAVYNSFVYTTPNNNGGFNNGTGCPSAAVSASVYTVNCSGMQPPYAPRWSLSAGAQQTVPLPNSANLIGNMLVHYQSTTLTALDFLPVEEQHGYAMWNFDLTYRAQADKFYVGGYIDNAFNKTALAFSFVTPFSEILTSTLQPPRTFGVRIGTHF